MVPDSTNPTVSSGLRDFYDLRYQADYQLQSSRIQAYRVEATLAQIPKDLRIVLDYGCGQGSKEGLLEKRFQDSLILGIDISKEATRKAYKRFPRHSFVVFNGSSSPFPNQSFDLVFSYHVLEHVMDLEGTARDMSRLVRSGGYLCVILPCGNPGSVEEKIVRLMKGEERSKTNEVRWSYEDEGHLRRVNSQNLIEVFEKNGLRLSSQSYALQSWGGIVQICSNSPAVINSMIVARRAPSARDKFRIMLLKIALLSGSMLFWPLAMAGIDKVSFMVGAKEWNEHNREANGSEQFLVFRKP